MQWTTRSLSAAVALLTCVGTVHALCMRQAVKKDDPHAYIMALITSWGYAKDARDNMAGAMGTSTADDPLTQATQLMIGLKHAINDFECAASIVDGYTSSSDKTIRVGALNARTVYKVLAQMNGDLVDEVRAALDPDTTSSNPADDTERMAELAVQMDETWKSLILSATMATYTVLDLSGGEDSPANRFRITLKQREEIIESLRASWGSEIEGGMRAGQLPLEASASALYAFVADMQWKSAD